MSLTPEQRSQRARIAALTRWSRHDPRPTGYRAQAGLMRRFENEVDPNRELPEEERQRRAEAARKAHMTRLAYRSAIARSRKASGDRAIEGESQAR